MRTLQIIITGWRIIFRLLRVLVNHLREFLLEFLRLLGVCKKKGRQPDEVGCYTPPPDVRARPDPYIYSQQWQRLRNLAYSWDNPDFAIRDPATNTFVNNHNLKPNTTYIVEATIHNGSTMSAIDTSVHFQVRGFGGGTLVTTDLGTVTVDVPAGGKVVPKVNWLTPATGGHNCLQVIIFHLDDANPLNNIGEHNTDVAVPAGPIRRISFQVGNQAHVARNLQLVMDSYRLPREPMRARNFEERQSSKYLKRLQAENDPGKFPVPDYLHARLSRETLEVPPRTETEVSLELTPPPKGSGRHSINVHILDGQMLIGGITAYVDEEGA